jgi:3-hydroxyisobutyrate dehydrogenase-like beta-hydroxyacid dehydrogenase
MQLGFVGVGVMGVPIVRHLVGAGHTVRAFDPSSAALDKAQAAGAQGAPSVGGAAAGAQVVFVAVSNQDVLGEVLRQLRRAVGPLPPRRAPRAWPTSTRR